MNIVPYLAHLSCDECAGVLSGLQRHCRSTGEVLR